MNEFCPLRAKTYSYLMDDNIEVRKPKGTKIHNKDLSSNDDKRIQTFDKIENIPIWSKCV